MTGAFLLKTQTKSLVATGLGIAWIIAIVTGLGLLLKYNTTPGRTAQVPPQWPETKLSRAADRPTLVMVAHPRCPCTRASIGELARIMARARGKLAAYVLFVKPKESGSDWDATDLQSSAANIPGVTVLSDPGGVEATRFGAETSGHTLLFDTNGGLLFSGGVTAARGHSGDNPGEDAVISLVNNAIPKRKNTFVFGCALKDPNPPHRARN